VQPAKQKEAPEAEGENTNKVEGEYTNENLETTVQHAHLPNVEKSMDSEFIVRFTEHPLTIRTLLRVKSQLLLKKDQDSFSFAS